MPIMAGETWQRERVTACGSGRVLTHLSRPNNRERGCRHSNSELSPFLFFTQSGSPVHRVVPVTLRAASPSLNSDSIEIPSHLNVGLHRILNPVKLTKKRGHHVILT